MIVKYIILSIHKQGDVLYQNYKILLLEITVKINPAPIVHRDGEKNTKIKLKVIKIRTEETPFTRSP